MPIGKKIRKLKLPKIISKNKKLFYQFLAGFLDTDGHIESHSFYLYQSDKTILEDIKNVLESLKVKTTLVYSPFKLNREIYNRFYLRFRMDRRTFKIVRLLKHSRHLKISGPAGI